jgi:hypothetical protein
MQTAALAGRVYSAVREKRWAEQAHSTVPCLGKQPLIARWRRSAASIAQSTRARDGMTQENQAALATSLSRYRALVRTVSRTGKDVRSTRAWLDLQGHTGLPDPTLSRSDE